MTILDAMGDEHLFGRWFSAESWRTWRICVSAIFGLPIVEASDRETFTTHTGRLEPPAAQVREAWCICGRRSGKSRMAALLAVFTACFRDHRAYLAPGEVATIPVIAVDRRQARTVFRYALALLHGVPMLKDMIRTETRESVELSNGARLEIHTASFRGARSYTSPCAVIDEVAFLRADDFAAVPDREIAVSLRYAMANVPDPLLVGISSPFGRRGLLYEMHERYWGQPGDVLIWKSDSKRMNPLLSATLIATAYSEDPSAADSELGGNFRGDLENFIGIEELRRCVVPDRVLVPPAAQVRYFGATDAAAGAAGGDSWCGAVLHVEPDGRAVVDQVLEIRPPFQPSQAAERLAAELFRPYRVTAVVSDKYASQFLAEQLRRVGLGYIPTTVDRSAAYTLALPWLTGQRVELPDHPRLLAQFANLQRRTSSSGRESIDHPRGGHDDLSNAVALGLASLTRHNPLRATMARAVWGGSGHDEHTFQPALDLFRPRNGDI